MDEVKSSEVSKALAAQSKFAHSQAKAITAQAVWDALSTYGPAFAVSGAVDEETASTAVNNLVGALGGVVKYLDNILLEGHKYCALLFFLR